MTKTEFLEGQPFTYNGPFVRLQNKPLRFDRKEALMIDEKENDSWGVTPADNSFIAFKRAFGKVPILYGECRLIDVPVI